MTSPSNFIDFNTFYDLQGAAEESAMQKRLDELAALDEESAILLRRGEGEAEMANLNAVRGGQAATMGLEGTASYGQYLKAQQKAKDLRAALEAASQGINNAGLGVRAAAKTGATTRAEASRMEQDRLRNYFTQKGADGVTSFNKYAAEMKARAEAEAKAKADKKAADDDAFKANALAFLKKWSGAKTTADKQGYARGIASSLLNDAGRDALMGADYDPGDGSGGGAKFNEKGAQWVRSQAFAPYSTGKTSTYQQIWNNPNYLTPDEQKWKGR